jgi:hypothetical protein
MREEASMTRARPLAAVLAAGFLITSCGSARAATPPARTRAPTATSSPAPTTIPAKVRRAITHDYQAFWHAVFAAYDPPRPDDPNLARYSSGSALSNLRQALETDSQLGVVRRGSQALDPALLTVTGATATVRDCYTNNLLSYALAGNSLGVPANTRLEDPAPPKLRVATLIQDGGVWKVDGVSPPVEEQRTCGSIKDEQRAIEAYKRYHRVLYDVYRDDPPNPNDPRLNTVLAHANSALQHARDGIRQNRDRIIGRWTSPKSITAGTVEVVSFTRNRAAQLTACFVEDGTQTDRKTREIVSPPSTSPTSWTYDLVVERGRWKVAAEAEGAPCTLP